MAVATPPHLVGGIDAQADTIQVAVVTKLGKPVGDAEFRTGPDGHQAAIVFLTSSGLIERVGVKGRRPATIPQEDDEAAPRRGRHSRSASACSPMNDSRATCR